MSLSAALSSALSGLTASSRRAEVVSTNIANAATPGYVRRQVELSSRLVGDTANGVQVDGITRTADAILIADRRIAVAEGAGRGLISDFLAAAEQAFGAPDAEGSLGSLIGGLDRALIAAAALPQSEARLSDVMTALRGLTHGLHRASGTVQEAREAAETRIAAEVERVNSGLAEVAELNARITARDLSRQDLTGLMDRRQQVIDRLAEIIPLREAPRDGQRVALYTTGGAILLEDGPVRLEFRKSGVITAEMTGLNGLLVDGRPVRMGENGTLEGGTLAASFRIRDDLAVGAQARLDALARDVAERLATVDGGAAAGLLTDGADPVAATAERGLAQRLAINIRVDPQAGGALWRLRDGLQAAAPGPAGDGSRLTAYAAALAARREPASGAVMPGARSLAALAADLASQGSAARLAAESSESNANARATALRQMELTRGVDTDAELQELMLVEQAYSANARVMQTMDELLKKLMGL